MRGKKAKLIRRLAAYEMQRDRPTQYVGVWGRKTRIDALTDAIASVVDPKAAAALRAARLTEERTLRGPIVEIDPRLEGYFWKPHGPVVDGKRRQRQPVTCRGNRRTYRFFKQNFKERAHG